MKENVSGVYPYQTQHYETGPIDFHGIFFFILWRPMGLSSCLVTFFNILQNILFYIQQKKETHASLKQLEGWVEFSFLGGVSL